MIDEIYINGDSYSAVTKETVPYSKYLGDLVGVPVINFAVPGSSNDRIFRTSLEYCAGLSKDQKPLIVIGFSFVTREETWMENVEKYSHWIRDYAGSRFISTAWLEDDKVDETTMHLIIDQNINKQMVNFYTKLFMFTQVLKSLNLPYFLFSAADNRDFRNLDWTSLGNLNIYQHIQQDPYVANLHSFNIGAWAEENNISTTSTKHLYSDGHKKFADFLYTNVYDLIR